MKALVIQMGALLPASHLKKLHDDMVEQLKTGVVIVPGYAKAKLVNVPDDIEVIVKPYKEDKNDVEF